MAWRKNHEKNRGGVDIIVGIITRIYRRWKNRMPSFLSPDGVVDKLQFLDPEKNIDEVKESYYVKKITIIIAVLFMGILLGIVLFIMEQSRTQVGTSGDIKRDMENDKEIQLIADYRGEQFLIPLTVSMKKLTREEFETMSEEFGRALPSLIMGENETLDSVRCSLRLIDMYEGYPFYVDWSSSRIDVISENGQYHEVDEDVDVSLIAKVSYEKYEKEYSISVNVKAPNYDAYTEKQKDLKKIVTNAELQTLEQATWSLPREWEGNPIKWREKSSQTGGLVVASTFLLAIVLFLVYDKDLADRVKKRQEQLKREYPLLLHKMVLYIGAGMSVRGTIARIVKDYEAEGKGEKPICMELCGIVANIQAGISEGKVYETWGRRIGIQEYIKLGTLLSQNIRYGNRHLLERLREEANHAMDERLMSSRKLSEEAGTKLIVPMVIQLAIVLIIIVVPAFWQI